MIVMVMIMVMMLWYVGDGDAVSAVDNDYGGDDDDADHDDHEDEEDDEENEKADNEPISALLTWISVGQSTSNSNNRINTLQNHWIQDHFTQPRLHGQISKMAAWGQTNHHQLI